MPHSTVDRTFEAIEVGETATRSLEITAQLVDAFAAVSGDFSPIHIDVIAARARGFEDRVAHGALLVALVSGIIGVELPGARGLQHATSFKFRHPCCVGRRVTVSVTVREKIPSVQVLLLDATVRDERGRVLAQGDIQCGLGAVAGRADGG